MTIDSIDEDENASDSIRANLDPDSNKTEENDLQAEKHDEPRISTLRGTMIDRSDEYVNASDSMCLSFDSDSNEIDDSD
jgi:hypothetical protein